MKYFVLFIFVLAFASHAWANVDQRCLKLCKDGGDNTPTCMTHCTYDEGANGASPISQLPINGSHNVFVAPRPIGQTDLMPIATSGMKPETSKDFACVNECLRDGGQYPLCNERCLRNDCQPGSRDKACKDVRGIAPQDVMPQKPVSLSTMLPGSNNGYKPPTQ